MKEIIRIERRGTVPCTIISDSTFVHGVLTAVSLVHTGCRAVSRARHL